MLKKLNGIPIINNIEEIIVDDIKDLLTVGACYFKNPIQNKKHIDNRLQQLKSRALTFFNQSLEDKGKTVGYNDRRQMQNPELVERLSFPVKNPSNPFKEDDIADINTLIRTTISAPLLTKIFEYVEHTYSLQMKQEIDTIIDNNGTYLSFVCYPQQANLTPTLGLKKHKDLGLLTVLLVSETGLQIRTQITGKKDWIAVEPLQDYFVIVLGNALQLLLGKERCNAVSHKVELTTTSRLTIGFFFNPVANQPIVNLFTKDKLFDNFYPDYVNKRLLKYQ